MGGRADDLDELRRRTQVAMETAARDRRQFLEALSAVERTHGGRPEGVVQEVLRRELDRRGLDGWAVEDPQVAQFVRAISSARPRT